MIEHDLVPKYITYLAMNRSHNNDPAFQTDVLSTFSSMVGNLKSEEIINLIYSKKWIDDMLFFRFNFQNEDVVFYYINFLKTIVSRFTQLPLILFYNPQKLCFPVFHCSIRFYNCQDSLARTTAFNIILNLLWEEKGIKISSVFIEYPYNIFFQKVCSFIIFNTYSNLLKQSENSLPCQRMKEELLDYFGYIRDFLWIEDPLFNKMISTCIYSYLIFPNLSLNLNSSRILAY